MKTVDGRLYVVSGASRCGKSTQVARMAGKSRRIAAWDPEAQWCDLPGWRKVTTRKELLAAMQTAGHMRIAYVAGGDLKDEFDFMCGCVMFAGRHIAPLDFVAEELADVTTPSKAPGNWGILVRRGLKRGINIYAISQRWSEADKTAMGNASYYIVFTTRPKDVKYVANSTGLDVEQLKTLAPFEFFMIDPVTHEITKKKLAFKR
jgi:hypothetical protein